MKTKSKLITHSVIKLVIAIALCFAITLVANAFAPHISNDLAIGQLQNDDMSWSIMQTWYAILDILIVVKLVIFAICGVSIGVDIYHYIKLRGEN